MARVAKVIIPSFYGNPVKHSYVKRPDGEFKGRFLTRAGL
jgi:hypothetical protein